MPSQHKVPLYQRHKARDKGKVRINGRDIYFPGKYDSPESRDAYRELVAKMQAEHQQQVALGRGEEFLKGECLVVELMVAYLRHADQYYSASNEADRIREATRALRDLYGRLGVD